MRKTNMENKTLEDVINHPNFGNLAKLTVLTIITVGFVVAGVIIVVRDGDIYAYVEAAKVLAAFMMAAVSGGVVTTFGKSETAKTVLLQKELMSHNEPPLEYYGTDLQNGSGNTDVVSLPSVDDSESLSHNLPRPLSYRITEDAYREGITWDSLNSRYGFEPGHLESVNPGLKLTPGSVVNIS